MSCLAISCFCSYIIAFWERGQTVCVCWKTCTSLWLIPPPLLVFPLILSLTDKSRISLCVAVLVSPEPFSHAQLHQRFLTNLCNLLWYAQLLTICFHQKVSLGYKQCVLLWTSEKVNYVFHWVITLPQSHLILFSVRGFFCYVFFFPPSAADAGICKETVSHINLLTVPSVKVLKTEIYLTAAP